MARYGRVDWNDELLHRFIGRHWNYKYAVYIINLIKNYIEACIFISSFVAYLHFFWRNLIWICFMKTVYRLNMLFVTDSQHFAKRIIEIIKRFWIILFFQCLWVIFLFFFANNKNSFLFPFISTYTVPVPYDTAYSLLYVLLIKVVTKRSLWNNKAAIYRLLHLYIIVLVGVQ